MTWCVFGELVTQCPRCGDHLRVLAFITDLQVTGHILEHLELSSDRVRADRARTRAAR